MKNKREHEHELFHRYFSKILPYLKEHVLVAASVYFHREASQGSTYTYFLVKYYSREYLNVEIPYLKLFQGEYLFPGRSTYLLVNKY